MKKSDETTEKPKSISSGLDDNLKIQFNEYVVIAKSNEECADWKNALENYRKALNILPSHPKLPFKIKALEAKLNIPQTTEKPVNRVVKPKTKEKEVIVVSKNRPDVPEFTYDDKFDVYKLISKEKSFVFNGELFSKLYDYQRDGIAWLCKLHQYMGGILADGTF